ncbi:ectonucleotide pyrophosphatase/phosphodiesterase family member 5 [Aplysia californica]|uniref:Ectonucleotide pyrophosphatase/phosphodiesterase family member 5 n=1 Tax=Aplysia californica TaxID=6500 RepID=A0ABM0K5H2_APLCA|nr:ectonucleotide pyrophosphatase/phosphodiesterase family member 5 [Aplysia californica]
MDGSIYLCLLIILTLLHWPSIPVECSPVYKSKTAGNPLLIVSFDGFRWNYLQRTATPNFDKFLLNGVHARYGLKNAFITKTFPNHFTLATGLWEESHGIVANTMYDPILNQSFTMRNATAQSDPAWFDAGGEPIWVTNQIQKTDGRSGVMMWVGGEAPVKWVLPSRHVRYDGSMKNFSKVDTVISWYLDKYPINLGMMYFDQPDAYGHAFGPDSDEVTRMIGGLDEVVGYLLQRLEEVGLLGKINVILTSDHGFAETPKKNFINLDDYIDPETYEIASTSPVADIWPHEGKLEEIYMKLKKGSEKSGHFTVFKKEEIPTEFHYTKNQRIPPIVVVAKDTFSFTMAKHPYYNKGNHGFDNRLQDMHPFFVAMGPAFKSGYAVDTFHSVDVYPLMCHLLGLEPSANNGTMEVVSQLLMSTQDSSSSVVTFTTYVIGIVVISCVAGLYMVAACRYHRYLSLKRKSYKLLAESSLSARPSSSLTSTAVVTVGTSSDSRKTNEAKTPLLADVDGDN